MQCGAPREVAAHQKQPAYFSLASLAFCSFSTCALTINTDISTGSVVWCSAQACCKLADCTFHPNMPPLETESQTLPILPSLCAPELWAFSTTTSRTLEAHSAKEVYTQKMAAHHRHTVRDRNVSRHGVYPRFPSVVSNGDPQIAHRRAE